MKSDSKRRLYIISRIFREAKPIWGWLVFSCFLSLFQIILGVLAPKILGNTVQILYDYWAGELITDNLAGTIVRNLIPLALIYVGMSASDYAIMYLLNNVVSRYYTCNVRIRISEKIKHLPVKFIDSTPVGEILRRLMDDVSQMGSSIHTVIETIFPVFLQMALIIGIMFFESWQLAIVVLLLTPLSVFLSSKISSASEKYFTKMFEESGKLSSVVE